MKLHRTVFAPDRCPDLESLKPMKFRWDILFNAPVVESYERIYKPYLAQKYITSTSDWRYMGWMLCCCRFGKRWHRARVCKANDQRDGTSLWRRSRHCEVKTQKSKSGATSGVTKCSIHGPTEPSWNEVWDDTDGVPDNTVAANGGEIVLSFGWVCAVDSRHGQWEWKYLWWTVFYADAY